MKWRLFRVFQKPDKSGIVEADHAVQRARNALDAVRRQGPEVEAVTSSLNRLHIENHWSEQFRNAMRRY